MYTACAALVTRARCLPRRRTHRTVPPPLLPPCFVIKQDSYREAGFEGGGPEGFVPVTRWQHAMLATKPRA